MPNGYYHNPPKPVSTRVRCPVCKEAVYSRAGIHPQCAVRQSDPPTSKKPSAVIVIPTVLAGEVAGSASPILLDAPGIDLAVTADAHVL